MKKRILSLLLSLSMVSCLASFNVSAVEEPEGTVTFEYYKDAALSQQITGNINTNEFFYLLLKCSDFTEGLEANSIAASIEFDPQVVKLCNYGDENLIADSEIPLISTGANANVGSGNSVILHTGDLVTSTFHFFDIGASVNNSTGKVMAYFGNALSNEKTQIVGTKSLYVLKFKSIANGDSKIKRLTYSVGSEANNPFSISTSDGNMVDITVQNDGLIVSDRTKLATPSNVMLNTATKTFSWSEVANARQYKVRVINDLTSDINEYTVNSSSFTVPNEYDIGKTTILVKALGYEDGALKFADSDMTTSSPELVLYKTLAKPSRPVWTDKTLSWNPVQDTETYHVVLKENGSVVFDGDVTGTNVDLSSKLNAPVNGKNTYIATVKAVGSGYYNSSVESDAATVNMCGKLSPATGLAWVETSATWVASADSANVDKYKIELIKNNELVDTYYSTGTSYNFNTVINNTPGSYTFKVTALSKINASGDKFDNSDTVSCGVPKVISVPLQKVTNLVWNDRVLTWTDDLNEPGFTYEVKLIKKLSDGTLQEIAIPEPYSNSCTFDFGSYIDKGDFEARVLVKGYGEIYLDSEYETTGFSRFATKLQTPSSLGWNVNNANWADIENEVGYKVTLYRNGKESVSYNLPENTTEYAFPAILFELPGTYTFTVKAERDDDLFSPSDYAHSDIVSAGIKEVTVVRDGNTNLVAYKTFDDGVLSDAITANVECGDPIYVALEIETPVGKDVSNATIPVKFNSDVLKLVNFETNEVVADGTVSNANGNVEKVIYPGEQKDVFVNSSSNVYPYVDNTNGLIKLSFSCATIQDSETSSAANVSLNGTSVVILKFIPLKTGNAYIRYATDADEPYYDLVAASGTLFANSANQKVWMNEGIISNIIVEKGRLDKPENLEWADTKLSWDSVENSLSYTLKIYKNNSLIKTIANVTTTEKELKSYMSGVGSYKVTVTAIGDDINFENSDESVKSEAYEVKRKNDNSNGGGGSSTIYVPTTNVETNKLTDIDGHWASTDIIDLVNKGIIDGYDDNTFRPDWGITRAEFTKLMVTALGYEMVDCENVYTDTVGHWAEKFISVGTLNGIVDGIGENMFAPDEIVTREQMATIIHRMMGKTPASVISGYADRADIPDWAGAAVDFVSEKLIMVGFEDNTFRGAEPTNRAQAATVIARLIKSGVITGIN